ncbi:MAG: hypothetical protein EOO28_10435 [Comamonadaceae bacterium]|nr:MAG: hypothetical protein EOO28_10435 [Comamonadaceae bacterium]
MPGEIIGDTSYRTPFPAVQPDQPFTHKAAPSKRQAPADPVTNEKPVTPGKDYSLNIFSTGSELLGQRTATLRREAAQLWGANVAVLSAKPGTHFEQPAIWPSSSGIGYGIHVWGQPSTRVADLQRAVRVLDAANVPTLAAQAAWTQFSADVRSACGDRLACAGRMPDSPPQQAVIWKSRTAGEFDLMLVDGRTFRARSLAEASDLLTSHGVVSPAPAPGRQDEFVSQANLRWNGAVQALDAYPPADYPHPAVWPSESQPGRCGLFVPGHGYEHVDSLDEADAVFRRLGVQPRGALQTPMDLDGLEHETQWIWGDQVAVKSRKPHARPGEPALWLSTLQPGMLGLMRPDGTITRAADLQQAVNEFAAQGIDPRMGSGKHITINGPGLTPAARLGLEDRFGVAIKPILLDGKEIAYRIGMPQSASHSNAYFSCHGASADDAIINKPPGLRLAFAGPHGMVLRSNTITYARELADDAVVFPHPSQMYGPDRREVPNYLLGSGIGTSARDMSVFTRTTAGRAGDRHRFDTFLLNRDAHGMRLGDMLQGMQDTLKEEFPQRLTCHFCRHDRPDAPSFENVTITRL